MGSNEGRGLDDWTDSPMGEFNVIISSHYWLGIYPLTQCQWQFVMDTSPSHFKGSNLPVESTAWEEAMEFCNQLNVTVLPHLVHPDRYLFRLPTEAEWEYACRAGSSKKYQIGDTFSDLYKVAWHGDNVPEAAFSTQAVGQKLPNAWGLYDMLGNVMEMCCDVPVDYPAGTSQIDWVGSGGPLKDFRNIRGGSVFQDPGAEDELTCFGRAYTSGGPHRAYGFRVCLGPEIKPPKEVSNQ